MTQPPKVRSGFDSLHRSHDLLVPLSRDFWSRLFREISDTRFEINPELRAEEEVHE